MQNYLLRGTNTKELTVIRKGCFKTMLNLNHFGVRRVQNIAGEYTEKYVVFCVETYPIELF